MEQNTPSTVFCWCPRELDSSVNHGVIRMYSVQFKFHIQWHDEPHFQFKVCCFRAFNISVHIHSLILQFKVCCFRAPICNCDCSSCRVEGVLPPHAIAMLLLKKSRVKTRTVPFALGKLSASIARDASSVATRNSLSVNYVEHVNVMIALTMGTWFPMEIGATNAAFAKLRQIRIVHGASKSGQATAKCQWWKQCWMNEWKMGHRQVPLTERRSSVSQLQWRPLSWTNGWRSAIWKWVLCDLGSVCKCMFLFLFFFCSIPTSLLSCFATTCCFVAQCFLHPYSPCLDDKNLSEAWTCTRFCVNQQFRFVCDNQAWWHIVSWVHQSLMSCL